MAPAQRLSETRRSPHSSFVRTLWLHHLPVASPALDEDVRRRHQAGALNPHPKAGRMLCRCGLAPRARSPRTSVHETRPRPSPRHPAAGRRGLSRCAMSNTLCSLSPPPELHRHLRLRRKKGGMAAASSSRKPWRARGSPSTPLTRRCRLEDLRAVSSSRPSRSRGRGRAAPRAPRLTCRTDRLEHLSRSRRPSGAPRPELFPPA